MTHFCLTFLNRSLNLDSCDPDADLTPENLFFSRKKLILEEDADPDIKKLDEQVLFQMRLRKYQNGYLIFAGQSAPQKTAFS